jgi:hypothetical protein
MQNCYLKHSCQVYTHMNLPVDTPISSDNRAKMPVSMVTTL